MEMEDHDNLYTTKGVESSKDFQVVGLGVSSLSDSRLKLLNTLKIPKHKMNAIKAHVVILLSLDERRDSFLEK